MRNMKKVIQVVYVQNVMMIIDLYVDLWSLTFHHPPSRAAPRHPAPQRRIPFLIKPFHSSNDKILFHLRRCSSKTVLKDPFPPSTAEANQNPSPTSSLPSQQPIKTLLHPQQTIETFSSFPLSTFPPRRALSPGPPLDYFISSLKKMWGY